jgi:hypothetical protein
VGDVAEFADCSSASVSWVSEGWPLDTFARGASSLEEASPDPDPEAVLGPSSGTAGCVARACSLPPRMKYKVR